MKPIYCFAQNQISLIENAGVPVGDLLVQRGYGIFDYLRVANNKPLFIEAHLDRLFNSAKIMRLTITQSKEELKKIVGELIEKNNIPFQRQASSRSTGTDTDAFAYSNDGVVSALISLPLRYMHTTVEMIHKEDVENVIQLIYESLLVIKNGQDFKYLK